MKLPFPLILLPIFLVIILLFTGRFKSGSEAAEVVALSPPTGTTEHTKISDPLRKFSCRGRGGLAYLAGCYGQVLLDEGGEGGHRGDRPNAGARTG